jgi:hypothetical protein
MLVYFKRNVPESRTLVMNVHPAYLQSVSNSRGALRPRWGST